MLWLRVGKLSQVSPLLMDSMLQITLEEQHPRDWHFPARMHRNGGWVRHSSPLSHFWVPRDTASLGQGQVPPCPSLRYHGYIHMNLTFPVPLPRSPQALVILVLSGATGRMGRAEVPGIRGAGTENPPQGGRTACELTQALLSL